MNIRAPLFISGLSVCALVGVFFVSLLSGTMSLTLTDVVDSSSVAYTVVWDIRLPRVVLATLVGAGLGLCGAVMQGLFRNPLADPGLLGISSGAALGAALAIVGLSWLTHSVLSLLAVWLVPLAAFVAGLAVMVAIYLLSRRQGQTDIATLLLAGVAIQAILGACLALLSYVASSQQLQALIFWAMGSLGLATWQSVGVVAFFVLPSAVILLRYARALDALALGEDNAFYLGYAVENIKRNVIVLSALIVSVCVALTGVIGFVGLVVPHVVRLMVGAKHSHVLPLSMLTGAILLVLADMFARVVISPAELPIGILTALLGGPFFLYLLLQRQRFTRQYLGAAS